MDSQDSLGIHQELVGECKELNLCPGKAGTYTDVITYTNLHSTLLLGLEFEKSEHFNATDLTE